MHFFTLQWCKVDIGKTSRNAKQLRLTIGDNHGIIS
jgi:hypothetical protein